MLRPLASCHDSKRSKRREAMLCAAHSLFLEKGYEATTLGDIVGRSGGSLATLYDLFENKPGLLHALVTERCVGIDGTLDTAMNVDRPFAEVLRGIAEEMLDALLDPHYVGLFRIVTAQCAAHPELGRKIYDNGPALCQAKSAQYFARLRDDGILRIDDPVAASRLFFQMVCGHFHMEMVFGLPVELSPEERARHLDFVLPAFLRIYAPPRDD